MARGAWRVARWRVARGAPRSFRASRIKTGPQEESVPLHRTAATMALNLAALAALSSVLVVSACVAPLLCLVLLVIGAVLHFTLPNARGRRPRRLRGTRRNVTFAGDPCMEDAARGRRALSAPGEGGYDPLREMVDHTPHTDLNVQTDASSQLAYALACRQRMPDWNAYYSRSVPNMMQKMRRELDATSRMDNAWRLTPCSTE